MNCRGCLLAGVAILLVGLLALGVFTITGGHFLTAVDAFSQADAIVVLGGDGGNFFRVQRAVDLFNESYAPVVVFSGGTIEQGSRGARERGSKGAIGAPAPPYSSTEGDDQVTRVQSHEELDVYRLAFDVAMKIFALTKRFPREEIYSLTDQIRRSSRSVCSNIAEAWRKRRYEAAFVSKLNDADSEACPVK